MVGHDPVVEGGFVFVVAVVVFADVKPDAEGLIVGAVEKARIGSGPEGEESDDPFGPENR